MELIIITGMSGAGKSVVVDALEDLGYFVADNMPPKLIPVIANFLSQSGEKKKVATVTDIRVGNKSLSDFDEAFKDLKDMNIPHKILFVDASDSELVRRYKETRRRHPLLDQSEGSLPNAVSLERANMQVFKNIADYTIDTTNYKSADCRNRVYELFSTSTEINMKIRCISFGFKHGIPTDADIVFDVRCLPNPFYVEELKEHTGLDKDVADYVMSFEESRVTYEKLQDLIDYMVPLYIEEGKSQLIIAIGCTGGHHRSVCFAQKIGTALKEQNYEVKIKHRDIDK